MRNPIRQTRDAIGRSGQSGDDPRSAIASKTGRRSALPSAGFIAPQAMRRQRHHASSVVLVESHPSRPCRQIAWESDSELPTDRRNSSEARETYPSACTWSPRIRFTKAENRAIPERTTSITSTRARSVGSIVESPSIGLPSTTRSSSTATTRTAPE